MHSSTEQLVDTNTADKWENDLEKEISPYLTDNTPEVIFSFIYPVYCFLERKEYIK